MGRENKKSLIAQVCETLQNKLKIGVSKHDDKKKGIAHDCIYSWGTYHAYMQQCCDFVKWCKSAPVLPEFGHKPRTLDECKLYVKDYIRGSVERDLSPYTIKLQISALVKLYGCKAEELGVESSPSRERKNIVRSRKETTGDRHFGEKKNADLITFCKCCGLRRAELQQIRGTDLIYQDGEPYLNVTRGTKGGRPRISPIFGSSEEVKKVVELLNNAGAKKVFAKVPAHADIHAYRAEYATRIYNAFKRPTKAFRRERMIIYNNRVIDVYEASERTPDRRRYAHLYSSTEKDKRTGKPKMLEGYRDVSSMYFCRDELAGTYYDRQALFEATKALGHNRESVVAEHYLRAIK